MPRRALTPAEKRKMQAARVQAQADKKDALAALHENSQFVNPVFWQGVDPDLLDDIEKAIAKSKSAAKQAKITALEAELAKLRGE